MRKLLLSLLAAMTLAAQTGATLTGHVADPHGQPITKATILLRPVPTAPGPPPQPYAALTNDKGDFFFEGVDPGNYTLSATRTGFLPFTLGATHASPAARPFTLVAGKPASPVAIVLTPAAAISGKVLDEDGEPVSAFLTISRERFEEGVRKLVIVKGVFPEVDGDGRYRISGLEAGRYYLTARAPGPVIPFPSGGYASTNGAVFIATQVNSAARPGTPKSDYTATWYPDAIDQRDARPLDLIAGQELSGVDIRMRKSAVFTMRGRINGAIPGHPVDQYRVLLSAPDRTSGVMATLSPNVSPDGTFEIVGIPNGDYDLTVASGRLGGPTPPLSAQRVSVRGHDAEGVVIDLKPLGSVSGSIVSGNDKPASGVTVNLTSVDGPLVKLKSGPTKETVQFELSDVPPGNYRVSVTGNVPGTYLKPGPTLEVMSGVAIDKLQLTLGQAGIVTGTAPAGYLITLVPEPLRPDLPELYKQAVTDDRGQFDLPSVPPGAYRVFAWKDIEPGAWFDPEFLKPHAAQSVPVTIEENATAQVKLPGIQ